MISGDGTSVINRHVWFAFITSSGKGCNGYCTCIKDPVRTGNGNMGCWLKFGVLNSLDSIHHLVLWSLA